VNRALKHRKRKFVAKKLSSGKVFENSIAEILKGYGYTVISQNKVKLSGSRNYKIDITAMHETQGTFDIEAKWQNVNGTTYQKLPFACTRLRKISESRSSQPVLVYGGAEMTKLMNTDYILQENLKDYPDVSVMHIGDLVLNLQSKGTLV